MRETATEVLTPTGAIVPVTASVEDAERRLVTLGVAELYVLEPDGQLAGVLPDYELLKRRLGGDGRTLSAGELMSRVDYRASCATPVRELALRMRQSCCARIPVVANGRLIGEVTRTGLLRYLQRSETTELESAPEPACHAPPDGPKFLRSRAAPSGGGGVSLLGGIAITE